jgi:hypothetical protein
MPADTIRPSFQNVVFASFLEYWTMDKVQKSRNIKVQLTISFSFILNIFEVEPG